MENSLTTLSSILNLINIPITMNDDLTNILQSSFNDTGNTNKPTDNKFIKDLKQHTFDENKEEISCGICLETFKKGEKAFVLPCKDSPHYFHIGEKSDDCCGILPWLKENNTCPICREEFPENEPEPESEDEDFSEQQNNEISRFLDEMNTFTDEQQTEEQQQNDDIESVLDNLNTEEISNLLANTLILNSMLRQPPGPRIRRRRHRNIILSQEDFEEMQFQEALQRSMSDL